MIAAMLLGVPALLAATVHSFAVGEVAFPFGLSAEAKKEAGPVWAAIVCALGWIGVSGVFVTLTCAWYCARFTREVEWTKD